MAQYEMNLRDYWLIVRRRRVIIIVSTALVMLLSFWFAKQKVPYFQASTAVKFEQSTQMSGLLVEVLSPSNANYDLVTKREAFARAGVPEYWIARPVERDILVHSEPEPATGQYLRLARVPPDGTLVSPTLPVRAAVAPFFAGAPTDTAP